MKGSASARPVVSRCIRERALCELRRPGLKRFARPPESPETDIYHERISPTHEQPEYHRRVRYVVILVA
jgi:hypothetical protein